MTGTGEGLSRSERDGGGCVPPRQDAAPARRGSRRSPRSCASCSRTRCARPRLVVHARRLERDDDPVLERAHRPLDLALCLRRRGYHVVDAESAAHAPELGTEVLALVAEERESVRVERLRHAVAQERGLEHGVVFEQVLAFADTMRRDLARGIVKREDEALVRAVGSPDVSWRRVVLVDLSVRLGLPATIVGRPASCARPGTCCA